jgi:hypothetical protein
MLLHFSSLFFSRCLSSILSAERVSFRLFRKADRLALSRTHHFSGSTCHVKKNHTEGKGEHKALYLRVQIFARISGDTEDRTGQSYKHKTSPDTVERGHVLRASKVETVQSTVGGLCCFHLTRPVPIPCLATTPS